MKYVDYCVCCNSKNLESFSAMTVPFLVARMSGRPMPSLPFPSNYIHCLDCDFVSVDLRFDREEENRYYQNYMKEEYIAHRCEYEGPGMRNLLESYSSPAYKEMRAEEATKIISKILDCSTIKSVLDYGGDTGEMIPKELHHADRFVTDIQVRQLPNGVKSVQDPSECGPVDLVICGHTLEHVSYPRLLLEDMKRYMKPGTWLYLEVPNDRTEHGAGAVFHEHINQFNLNCLKRLLTDHGFVDLTTTEITYKQFAGKAFVVTGRLA
jgi:SAM-dependent methyltransferase